VHQVGNQYIVNSWCTVRKTSSLPIHVSSRLTANRILPTGSQHKRMTYTNCFIYRVVPPADEQ